MHLKLIWKVSRGCAVNKVPPRYKLYFQRFKFWKGFAEAKAKLKGPLCYRKEEEGIRSTNSTSNILISNRQKFSIQKGCSSKNRNVFSKASLNLRHNGKFYSWINHVFSKCVYTCYFAYF
jgi:hypothetical protein